MSLESDFVDVIETSDALMNLLPGGVYSALELSSAGKLSEISRQNKPEAFDTNQELLTCALVKMGVEVPIGPYPDSVQTPVQIFFYQQYSAMDIDGAMTLAFALFNYKRIGSGSWRVEYESGSYNQTDDVLNANLAIIRFNAIRKKPAFEGGS